MNFRSSFLLLAALFAQCCMGSVIARSTSINPAGPYVPSCGSPQRYVIGVHIASNNTYVGHLRALVSDGNSFILFVTKSNPDQSYYIHEWLISADPADHGDFYIYVPPGYPLTNDTYYFGLQSINGIDKDVEDEVLLASRAQWPYFDYKQFSCSVAKKTNLVSCGIAGTKGSYEFVVRPSIEDDHPVNYPLYSVKGKEAKGDLPVYLKLGKSC